MQRFANLLEADSVTVELVRVELDADSGPRASPSKDLADAFNLGKFLREDGIGSVVDFRWGNVVRRQGEHQDGRVGRIDFPVVGLAGNVGGKLAASGVDGG